MKYTIVNIASKLGILLFWFTCILLFLYTGQIAQQLSRDKNINVLVWGQVLNKEFLTDFEKETGIHVNMSYFENNEELFVKLQSGGHDYDIIMPSDWAAQLLIEKELIKPLDRNKINVWNTLYPSLCNHYFDPGNRYTIPFYWSLFGLGVDTRYWKDITLQPTWGLIFNKQIMPPRISTVEDPRVLILISALYLFGRVEALHDQEIKKITQLLLQQKPHVEIYTDSRPEYILASGVVPIVVSLSGDLLKIMKRFEYIDFVIPQEGAFAIIDSLAITAATKKDDLIYPFLNYIFQKEIVEKYVDKFDFFPAVEIDTEYDERFAALTKPTKELFKNIHFFKNVISKKNMNDVLIALKS